MDDTSTGNLISGDGKSVGDISIIVPDGATQFGLSDEGPSKMAKAFLTGLDTGRLVASFKTDPNNKGKYNISLSLHDGNTLTHPIVAQ